MGQASGAVMLMMEAEGFISHGKQWLYGDCSR